MVDMELFETERVVWAVFSVHLSKTEIKLGK